MTRRIKTHCLRGHERHPDSIGSNGQFLQCERDRKAANKPVTTARQILSIRHEHNVRGHANYIRRRRARGIPVNGRLERTPIKQLIRHLEAA